MKLGFWAQKQQLKRAETEIFTIALEAVADKTTPQDIATLYAQTGSNPRTAATIIAMIEEDRDCINQQLANDSAFQRSFNTYAAARAQVKAFQDKHAADKGTLSAVKRWGAAITLVPAAKTMKQESDKLQTLLQRP
ncbi:MAG: hypothetical protein ACAH83_15265 [Alphaproteobacteria bacterium]